MSKLNIYLAGNITSDTRTFEWRQQFIELFNLDPKNVNFNIINPASTEFDKQLLKGTYTEDAYTSLKAKASYSQNIFRAKDYQLIKKTDIVVVNLDIIDYNRPLIGTIQELVWCKDVFYIPTIGIMGENVYCKHPWIKECLSAEVNNIEESIKLVFDFFS